MGGDVDFVQRSFPACGLHISVFALRTILVTDASVLPRANGTKQRRADVLDFASTEANLYLQYLSKAWKPGSCMVGAPREFFTHEVECLLLEGKVYSLADHLRGLVAEGESVKPELIAQADELGLCFAFGITSSLAQNVAA
jgi:hypothetical protein